ncbi:RNA binding protein 18 [Paragonimus heterotremus]|uniref:RNA binding protein 18 n=1 Tax=Paragonimus heterotremus TaxID=100268 RepID=A0A8J4SXJ5_9TREM|nr:RNA binding protein 18 [Paragonimus heterotremus]
MATSKLDWRYFHSGFTITVTSLKPSVCSSSAESGFKTYSNRSVDDLTNLGSVAECDPFRVWLGGLPPRITEYAVLQLTRQFGPLSDFHFPVHKVGDSRGSTVGYCFITYKDAESATKALKTLDSLNFHGHTLIARPARPTRDELSVIQRASEEAARLRIAEQAKLREAELAARLQCSDSELGKIDQTITCKPECETNESKSVGLSSRPSSELAVVPDLYGQLGRVNPKPTSALCRPITRPSKKIDARIAIQKIESALKRLEKTPVGGPALLHPASMQRPLISFGMFGHHPNRSTNTTGRGRAPSYLVGGSGHSARTRSRFDK